MRNQTHQHAMWFMLWRRASVVRPVSRACQWESVHAVAMVDGPTFAPTPATCLGPWSCLLLYLYLGLRVSGVAVVVGVGVWVVGCNVVMSPKGGMANKARL